MCTATYIPVDTSHAILTHSRDEKALRPVALPPQIVSINGKDVLFPKDPQSQGTWIATGQRADTAPRTVCLLNGAFTPHQPKPAYKHSRGLVIPHFFTYPSIDSFSNDYPFCAIEPFTLLILEADRLVELRWNGQRLFIHEKDPARPHIWSSVTLYSADIIQKREEWFRIWLLENPTPSVNDIRRFHQFAGDGDSANDLRMNRQNTLFTVSLTSVIHATESTNLSTSRMIYESFARPEMPQQTTQSSYAIA